MNEQSQVCFTLETALEKAIEMENTIFSDFLGAIQAVESTHAKDILREAALGKLNQKQQIEKALLEGTIDDLELHVAVPTMHLDPRFGKKQLSADADARDALSYSVHMVTEAIEFYHNMSKACTGAPMSAVFKRLGDEQTRLLQKLEDSYEAHFLTQN